MPTVNCYPGLDLTRVRERFGKCRHLPGELLSYAENVVRRGIKDDRFVQCLAAADRDEFISMLDGRFDRAVSVAGMNPSQFVRAMGFDPADTNKGRLESLLAQVRALEALVSFGASEVRPLPPSGTPEADFLALFNSAGSPQLCCG